MTPKEKDLFNSIAQGGTPQASAIVLAHVIDAMCSEIVALQERVEKVERHVQYLMAVDIAQAAQESNELESIVSR